MCTHRYMFDTDQEYVDALVKGAEVAEKSLTEYKSGEFGPVSDDFIAELEKNVKQDRAVAVQFQNAINAGKSLNGNQSLSDEIFDAVYAADTDEALNALLVTVDAPVSVPAPVGA